MRKLFYALSDGKRILVDRLTDREKKFLCPHCRKPVIPKMGEEKVWHFAHVGEPCSFLRKSGGKEGSLAGLPTVELSAFAMPTDEGRFGCRVCRKTGKKEGAVKVGDGWVCRECYLHRDVRL
jgi:hypothetical protein